jgi:hypothetical protein
LLVDHDHDNQHKTENQKIYIEKQKVVEKDELELNQIIETIEQLDNEEIKAFVGSVIKTYKRNGETS